MISAAAASGIVALMIDYLKLKERYTFFVYSAITFVVVFSSYNMS